MYDCTSGFPNKTTDVLHDIDNIKGNTNFSHMGEVSGIEIKCRVTFKVKSENILMDPDWEIEGFTDKFKNLFKNGYYIFEEERNEHIQYHFFIDYDTEIQQFNLVHVKKTDMPQKNYVKYIQNRYNIDQIEGFEKWLVQYIIEKRIKKRQFIT